MTDATRPESEAALAETIRDAAAARRPLWIEGGGTRTQPGTVPEGATRLSLAALSGIRIYEPGALTLVAAAGTPVAEIERVLAAEGQALPFEPMDHRGILGTEGEPTIGGVVATNASGPRRIATGACRDFLLGTRFVDASGRVLKNGGRVMKNVTGLDLGKLLCGSCGRFGILTEVALKVLPAPSCGETLVFADRTEQEAVALFCAALRTPYEVSGAAWRDGAAYLRIEGSAAQIAHRGAKLREAYGPTDVLSATAHDAIWRDLRDVSHFAAPGDLWRINIKPTAAPALARALRERLDARVSLDWGGGLIWASGSSLPAPEVQDIVQAADTHAQRLRRGTTGGPDAVPAPAPRVAALSRALRDQFDPAHILNPGLAPS